MAAILDTGTERCSNSESPCHPYASIGSIGPTVWEERSLEDFQDGCHGTILAILNLYDAPMPSTISTQSNLLFGSRYQLKTFKMAGGGVV